MGDSAAASTEDPRSIIDAAAAAQKKRRRFSGSFLALARGDLGLETPSRFGRPSKLTPKLAKTILEAIANGSHFHPACAAAGIAGSTATNWIERGRQHISEGIRSDYALFTEALMQAAAKGEAAIVSEIREHNRQDWRAGAFLLERRHPDRWGKKEVATSVTNVVISDTLAAQLVASMRVAGAVLNQSPPAIETTALPTESSDSDAPQ